MRAAGHDCELGDLGLEAVDAWQRGRVKHDTERAFRVGAGGTPRDEVAETVWVDGRGREGVDDVDDSDGRAGVGTQVGQRGGEEWVEFA